MDNVGGSHTPVAMAQGPQSPGSLRSGLRTPHVPVIKPDMPSSKYPDVSGPSKATLQRASSPPNPVLPRFAARRSWNATSREKKPLVSSLTGPARAGRVGELVGKSGARYEGEVLAGRPHGSGKYLVSKEPKRHEYVLEYEGDWVQGRREGYGTSYLRGGEVYQGEWVNNLRQGFGVLHYANGDVFEGMWQANHRTGPGTYHFANGNIFVGHYHSDKREGMGSLLMIPQGRKYVAEYVDDRPQCGTVLDIMEEDLQALEGQLAVTVQEEVMRASLEGQAQMPLPVLDVKQPNKVLAQQITRVRQDRIAASKSLKALQHASGTLADTQLEMLRHSFVLMAGGDSPTAGLQVHQLRELCVMAGLDPASSITRELVDELLGRLEGDNRIHLDKFLQVTCHYKELQKQQEAVLQPQQETQTAEAADIGAGGLECVPEYDEDEFGYGEPNDLGGSDPGDQRSVWSPGADSVYSNTGSVATPSAGMQPAIPAQAAVTAVLSDASPENASSLLQPTQLLESQRDGMDGMAAETLPGDSNEPAPQDEALEQPASSGTDAAETTAQGDALVPSELAVALPDSVAVADDAIEGDSHAGPSVAESASRDDEELVLGDAQVIAQPGSEELVEGTVEDEHSQAGGLDEEANPAASAEDNQEQTSAAEAAASGDEKEQEQLPVEAAADEAGDEPEANLGDAPVEDQV